MPEIEIKAESLPERCEVCHQTDCFDPEKNFCSRCASLVAEAAAPLQTTESVEPAAPPFTPTEWVNTDFDSIFNPPARAHERQSEPPSLSFKLNEAPRTAPRRRTVNTERPTFRIPSSPSETQTDEADAAQQASLQQLTRSSAHQQLEVYRRPKRQLAPIFGSQDQVGLSFEQMLVYAIAVGSILFIIGTLFYFLFLK